ncbi:peroxiredoxin [Deinococcus aquaticus]|uniref:peroxiredoxin n=1 Tax=Deinococcus aquaticus TaxID=328692 RepID=UPI003F44A3EB
MSLSTGDHVPSFTARRDDDQTFHFMPGQWTVLYFFPKTATTHCQLQARQYQANLPAFSELGAEVIGVNADPKREQAQFRDLCRLDYPILNDRTQALSREFDLLDDVWPGETVQRPRRETFLIDPEGVIRRHWKHVNPGQDAPSVLDSLRTLMNEEPEHLLS